MPLSICHFIGVGPLPRWVAWTLSGFRFSRLASILLSRINELARWVPFLQSFNLPVFQHELINAICELRRPELQPLDRDELLRRPTRKYQGEAGPRLVLDFELDFGRSHVNSRELFEKFRVQSRRLAREDHFGFVQRDYGVADVALRIRSEIHREPPVLFVIGRIEPVIVEMA